MRVAVGVLSPLARATRSVFSSLGVTIEDAQTEFPASAWDAREHSAELHNPRFPALVGHVRPPCRSELLGFTHQRNDLGGCSTPKSASSRLLEQISH